MKTVFSLTAAAMMALSGGVSAASVFSLSSADIPADFRLTQQHVFKGFGLCWLWRRLSAAGQ